MQEQIRRAAARDAGVQGHLTSPASSTAGTPEARRGESLHDAESPP